MRRRIVVNAANGEKRVAITEDRRLVEVLYEYERSGNHRTVGNIFLGVVKAVVPGLQAAFLDIGLDKAAFLHASDIGKAGSVRGAGLVEGVAGNDRDPSGESPPPNGAHGGPAPSGHTPSGRVRIEDVLEKGQTLLVQITKEAIGSKGVRATTELSIPGRFLVYIPGSSHIGVSRKIVGREARAGLRQMVRDVVGNGGGGVIVRTAGAEMTREACERELSALQESWEEVCRLRGKSRAPSLVHRDAKLSTGMIRDLFNDRVDMLTVDCTELYRETQSYLRQVAPELVDRVALYRKAAPIFDDFGIEEEIDRAFDRRVRLPAGGHIVIEPTEALVSIDVNSGSYTGSDPAKTVLKTNMQATAEIARQLRLRDLGGIIVIDFIDMEDEKSRQKVVQQMKTLLARDRARTSVYGISELGLLQLSRQRISPSLQQQLMPACPYCNGLGGMLAPETVVRRLERALERVFVAGTERGITILAHPVVALYLLEEERSFLDGKRKRGGIAIELRDNPLLGLDEFRLLAHPDESDVTNSYASGS